MKPTNETQTALLIPDDLNERVLEAAAITQEGDPAPEAPVGTTEITAWDQSSGTTGHRAPEFPLELEENISEQLVNAGNEEAGREQRVAAALEDQE